MTVDALENNHSSGANHPAHLDSGADASNPVLSNRSPPLRDPEALALLMSEADVKLDIGRDLIRYGDSEPRSLDAVAVVGHYVLMGL
jgi:hypothetical protein